MNFGSPELSSHLSISESESNLSTLPTTFLGSMSAANFFGGQASLARELNISSPAINQWISGARPVPGKRAVQIEKATGGLVTRKDLRPNDWKSIWPELV